MRSWFEKNLEILSLNQPEAAAVIAGCPPMGDQNQPLARLAADFGSEKDFSGDKADSGFEFPLENAVGCIALTCGPKGSPCISFRSPDGEMRLSSALAPQNEDQSLVDRFIRERCLPELGLTVFGFGLGYHAEYLGQKLPLGTPIWLWEARKELAAAAFTARDLSGLLKRPGFTLKLGPTQSLPPEAPQTILARPANLRLDAEHYPLASLGPTSPNPSASVRTRKKLTPRILFFDSGYFLANELPLAARANGSEIAVWTSPVGPTADGRDYDRLLNLIKEFRPEMILTVNHLGFDAEGRLSEVLARLGLPAASWFVDSPVFILGSAPKNTFSDLFVFSWDCDYLPVLNGLGFQKPRFLPLAASEAFFYPQPAAAGGNQPLPARSVAFVGDSLAAATDKYLALSSVSKNKLATIDRLAADFSQCPQLTPETLVAKISQENHLDFFQTLNLQALVTWRASRLARISVLSLVAKRLKDESESKLTIAGDAGWASLLPGAQLVGRLDYYQNLAEFYRTTAVNLNITSAQMKTGLNQRVFDVPACRGFLLTDRRNQLSEVFEPSEYATYNDPAEAAEKALWYLRRPDDRAKVAARAFRRVTGEHLYRHRLREIVATVYGGHGYGQ
ncbi:MAG: glycosyltransferase [Deltaproteobacteria bacterium]|jgi:spore maturation protein CgeB|nr:glycosyltransferase [Deltaproteobacteria bacterium]